MKENKMNQPTSRDIDKAKDYLRQRLNAELSMKNNLTELMLRAAKEIIAISYKYNIPPEQFVFSYNKELQQEIDAVIARLLYMIEDYTETLAVATHTDEKEHIISFIKRVSHGQTLSQRIGTYVDRYKYELEAMVAAGLLLEIGEGNLLQSIKNYFPQPYNNPYFLNAVKRGGLYATRLQTNGVSFGVGRTNSSFTAIDDATNFAIAEGWMDYFAKSAKQNGAIGFMSFRGSRYPCQLCDDETTYFHVFANGDPIPPYHAHCCCYIVPMYEIDF